MKIGLVGYKGSGKSMFFEWLTGTAPDPAQAHKEQSAMAVVPEPRVEALAQIYHPKKITMASVELVDTPGLSRTHEGNAARLALIREAGCLVCVVAAFGGANPLSDYQSFEEDLMLADMEIVSNRLQRIAETVKKPIPRTEKEQLVHEEQTLKLVLEALEAGKPLREADMNDEQRKVTRAFRLLTEKPRMVVVNVADDESNPQRFAEGLPAGLAVIPLPVDLELELSRMSPEERKEFETEMGLTGVDRDHIIRTIMDVSGQKLFLTAGEKEVRTWMLPREGTALDAAASIHTDLARGFIRAEVMTCADLVRLGSEREVKAQHLVRQEPKDYVVQDDDILLIRFSV
jgi:ribosome-binding ATPase YchF (GTP1/OBG family)